MAINWTPKMMVLWVANTVLKGIAQLSDYTFDLDARKAYVQTTLHGETEAIEVWLDGFAIVSDGETKKFMIEKAESNKAWLNTIFARVVGKAWKIPVIPQLKPHIELIAELLKAENNDTVES